ncbi:type II toxin-antitoxin system Phd/YefM family antitoxin [Coraliomargarita algicola]|uniref:Antitoxin n=1 Tax=Coraliomargarita algicola TaxID=3092156 RepID=A0ABZ0RRQ2_9BACT|nr:type II toxin-antitoxin system Phd/YefM family antitoxin [Coraliomargarita sp. J2-16]WPJ97929.1 type II toxin-antitoxin system Phd/YefM family antitoxin [Coraliomargarita sp. J2-16]
MSSTEARANFGAFLDKGSREPVIVKRQNREVGAFVPMEDLKAIHRLRLRELREATAELSEEGRKNGMTEEILKDILEEVNPS